jgi:hypothetical protein
MASTLKRRRVFGGISLVIFLLALFSLFGGIGIRAILGIHRITASYLYTSRLLYWLLLFVAWRYATRVEGQKLLIWKEKEYNFWVYILSLVVITAAVWMGTVIAFLIIYLATHHTESSAVFKQVVGVFRASPFLIVFTVLTAGVTEELIIRGYLLPRLHYLLKNPLIAIVLSSLVFAAAHLGYGTIINVAVPFIIGLALAFFYWYYRNIKVTIIFHVLWDLMVIYLAMRRT